MRILILIVSAGWLFAGCKKAHGPALDDPDALARRYEECWAFYSAARWDDLRGCYAPDAHFMSPGIDRLPDLDEQMTELAQGRSSFGTHGTPELVFVQPRVAPGGLAIVTGVVRVSGPHAGGFIAHQFVFDDTGHVRRDNKYYDPAALTPGHPLPSRKGQTLRVVPSGTGVEKASSGAVVPLLEQWLHGQWTAGAASFADDVIWMEEPFARELDKAGVLRRLAQIEQLDRRGHPWLDYDAVFLASDYVVVTGDFVRKDGPRVPILLVFVVARGKVKSVRLFYDRTAFEAPTRTP